MTLRTYVRQYEALELGAKDHEIANYARENELVVATNDRDFLDPGIKRTFQC
ncbi:MAG: putative nuclease of putative toxin-antitoxin system [Natronomonas sp.]|jgi:predicted nuclease of predicted toxin-antitoxin system|uniref:DUF5615 family PIN-like protein n=1 Tax=Natronomonas sp. TaxID=2184060 RepID=UPI003989AD6E